MYKYKAIVTNVYDGDTITVNIDLGFGIWKEGEKIRLLDIDTPEIRGEEREQGLIARDYLRSLILYKEIIIQTFKDKKGKYGRYLGYIYLPNETISINEILLKEGYAKPYE